MIKNSVSSDMVLSNNNAPVFLVNDKTVLNRFLVMGSFSSTMYASAKDNSSAFISRLVDMSKAETSLAKSYVDDIVSASVDGRAIKNDYPIVALAVFSASDNPEVRAYALSKVSEVCRIGTHIFQFASIVNGIRGWGKGLKKAVAAFYLDKTADKMAYDAIKYQQREGWSHKDILRLTHPVFNDPSKEAVARYITGGREALSSVSYTKKVKGSSKTIARSDVTSFLPRIIEGFELIKLASDLDTIVDLVREYSLPREAIPTNFVNTKEVWQELVVHTPLTGILRNLSTMTRNGLLDDSKYLDIVKSKFTSENIIRSRIHPMSILIAKMAYSKSRSQSGATWTPLKSIVDLLDNAFYDAFPNIEKFSGNTLIAVDVSGSMGWQDIANMTGVTPMIAATALAFMYAKVDPNVTVMAFSDKLVEVKVSNNETFASFEAKLNKIAMGGTDCRLPIKFAMDNLNRAFKNFVILTDSETGNYGRGLASTSELVKDYREVSGIDARVAINAMISNMISIADPNDPGMMDFVGFDTATPQIMTAFFNS